MCIRITERLSCGCEKRSFWERCHKPQRKPLDPIFEGVGQDTCQGENAWRGEAIKDVRGICDFCKAKKRARLRNRFVSRRTNPQVSAMIRLVPHVSQAYARTGSGMRESRMGKSDCTIQCPSFRRAGSMWRKIASDREGARFGAWRFGTCIV